MDILALDMATKTGWDHTSGAGGVWDLSIRLDESSGMRLIRFRAKLNEILLAYPDTRLIVFEQCSAMGGPRANLNAAKLQIKLQAVVEQLAEETDGLECCGYHLSTIKAHAIPSTGGKGHAARNKQAMVAAAKKRWPDVDIVDDNHADAMWLLDLASERLGIETKG